MNLGAGNVPGYRRCMRADVSQGAGRQMQLATSLRVLNNQLVLSGALLLPSYGCTLGRSGWVGFGLPESQAGTRQMFGARVFVAQPAPKAPTGTLRCAALCCAMLCQAELCCERLQLQLCRCLGCPGYCNHKLPQMQSVLHTCRLYQRPRLSPMQVPRWQLTC